MPTSRTITSLINCVSSRICGGLDATHVNLGTIGRSKISVPWPSLVRYVGSTGSGRLESTFEFVRQAIACGHDVIVLSSLSSRDPFGMVAAAELAGRSDQVHLGDVSRCPDGLLRSAIKSSRLRCFVWNDHENEVAAKEVGQATLEVFLDAVTRYVQDVNTDSPRTVIVLTGAMGRNHNEAATSRLIEASAGKNVTLVFSDQASCYDSFSTLRQADCILVSATHSPEDVHPYIRNLLRHVVPNIGSLQRFRERHAVIACRVFGRAPILGIADLPYTHVERNVVDTTWTRIVKVGPIGDDEQKTTEFVAAGLLPAQPC